MTVNSLRFRLVAGAALWVSVALVAVGFVLAGLFRDHVENSFEHQLALQLDRLAAVSEVAPGGTVKLRKLLADPRFEMPYSGWYWQIAGANGPLARSRSLWDQVLAIAPGTEPDAAPQRYTLVGPKGQIVWGLRRTVTLPGSGQVYQIAVAADVGELERAIARFNSVLAVSLLVLGAGLVAAIVVQVQVGLRPLGRLKAQLAAVRTGAAGRLEGAFPDEVRPLASELNALLDHNARIVARARTHVGNLAHALKTPITVLTNAAVRDGGPLAETVVRETRTLADLVDRHLARARMVAAGEVPGVRADVGAVLASLRRTLDRVHADRALSIVVECPDGLTFRGDRQDLEEMLGNLMDNACKWAATRVRVTASRNDQWLVVTVEDDGPGLPVEARARVFERGRRLDETVPGSGLGLAIVRDLAELYGGTVALEESPLGGLAARLALPTA